MSPTNNVLLSVSESFTVVRFEKLGSHQDFRSEPDFVSEVFAVIIFYSSTSFSAVQFVGFTAVSPVQRIATSTSVIVPLVL